MAEALAPIENPLKGEIFVVDDDAAIRDLLAVLFTRRGFKVVGFADGASLLATIRTQSPACILLDVHIPGKSGLDILRDLGARNHPAPVIMISGKGDIAIAVEAIKGGALDFIEKPFSGSDVVARVEEAIAADTKRKAVGRHEEKLHFYFPGREPLTAREQDVLGRIVEGATNKEAGQQLGISYRTIEIHRARIMEKLGARNAADLMRIVLSENRSPGA
ncbi:MAG TPA: response regulator [Xanthobacteraceae bacterium]|jgi:FixJ family two-component response regulator|nr:response regulator [Xanthobacteraceae bacterium]